MKALEVKDEIIDGIFGCNINSYCTYLCLASHHYNTSDELH